MTNRTVKVLAVAAIAGLAYILYSKSKANAAARNYAGGREQGERVQAALNTIPESFGSQAEREALAETLAMSPGV